MALALEEQIMQALHERLERITPDNGYRTDAGMRVIDYDPDPDEEPQGPFVQLGEVEMARAGSAGAWEMGVEVLGWVNASFDDWRREAFALLADVTEALQATDTTDLPCVAGTSVPRVAEKRMERRDPGSNYVLCAVTAAVTYRGE